jgi:hypothetical protein
MGEGDWPGVAGLAKPNRHLYPCDVRFEFLIVDLAAAGLPVEVLVVGRWGDRHAELVQLRADRLDTPPQAIRTVPAALMVSDERDD